MMFGSMLLSLVLVAGLLLGNVAGQLLGNVAGLLPGKVAASPSSYYTAAVYEHAFYGDNTLPVKLVLDANLASYKKATQVAKSKGADIIIFPEYGLFPEGNRTQLKRFLEDIPDPKKVSANPCLEASKYSDRPILQALSCMANQYSLFVVGNMGDIQKCQGDPNCPSDGVYQYNTNVVFNRNGTLVTKYHKEYLFFEYGYDVPRMMHQDPIFNTDFGKFATYSCFEMIYENMSRTARRSDIDGIAFTSMWVDVQPQFTSIQYQSAWSLGNDAVLLAADQQNPPLQSVGSGLYYHHKGALGYTFDPDGISKLVVSNIPKGRKEVSFTPNVSVTAITPLITADWTIDGFAVPKYCSPNSTFYTCYQERMTNYTMKKLVNPSGHVEACNNGMCCSLDYEALDLKEDFYFGVLNGSFNIMDTYFFCEEDCVLLRCDSTGGQTCNMYPLRSQTAFTYVHIKAKYTTDFVFPSMVSSDMRLVPRTDWSHSVNRTSPSSVTAELQFRNTTGTPLLTASLFGRCFDRDPPYVR